MDRRTRLWIFGALTAVALLGAASIAISGGSSDTGATDGPGGTATTASTAGTTSTTVSTTSTTQPPRTFTVAATGDFLIHSPVYRQALADGGGVRYEFSPMLADLAPVIRAADLGICHLEVPLSADDGDLSGYPIFSAPLELAADIAEAGYDTCSTASNHTLDRGTAGIEATLGHLDAAGVAHAGSARSPEEAATPLLLDAGGVTVAHLAYTYGFNGFSPPADEAWWANLIDADRILSDARAARHAGAEFVVVSVHLGNEYQHVPTQEQLDLVQALLPTDEIDLWIGHQAHVVQPISTIGTEVVAYGLGNILSNQAAETMGVAAAQDGVVLLVTVTEVEPGRFESEPSYLPTFVDRVAGYVVRPSQAAAPASFQRTVDAVSLLGDTIAVSQPD